MIGEVHQPETHLIPIALQTAAGLREHVAMYGTDYPTPDGTCIRDYIHVADAQAHVLGLEHLRSGHRSGDAFNLGNGQGFSVRSVLETAEGITGRETRWSPGPRRAGDPHTLVGSAVKVRRVLGWTQEFASLESIVETAWKWECRRALRR